MLPTNYKTADEQFLCDVCSQAVSNPLCPNCLALEVEAWLTMYSDLRKKLLPKIQAFIADAEDNTIFEPTLCIICNKNTTAICPYCFTEFVLNQLRRLNADKYIINEFFEFFNFDLTHDGYCNEVEELGIT